MEHAATALKLVGLGDRLDTFRGSFRAGRSSGWRLRGRS